MNAVFSTPPTQPALIFDAGPNKVAFESAERILVGDLFLPPGYQSGERLAGIVVDGSWTPVKEQMVGLYAPRLTRRGFAVLACSYRYYTKSDGEVREQENPVAKAADFTSVAAFLQSLPMIDTKRIGALVFCPGACYLDEPEAEDDDWFKVLVSVAAFTAAKALYWTHGTEIDIYGQEPPVSEAVTVAVRWFDKHLGMKPRQRPDSENIVSTATD